MLLRVQKQDCHSASGKEYEIVERGDLVSLFPSIGNWSHPCKSHYWIRDNKVIWAGWMNESAIRRGREFDDANGTPTLLRSRGRGGASPGVISSGTSADYSTRPFEPQHDDYFAPLGNNGWHAQKRPKLTETTRTNSTETNTRWSWLILCRAHQDSNLDLQSKLLTGAII